MNHIDQLLHNYGYIAIFVLLMMGIVGPLIPDETILVLAGILVHRGELSYAPALIAAYAGSFCGITLSYWLGKHGLGWLERHWPWFQRFSAEHLLRAELWFTRFGGWTLFFGYFVAGVRHFTALFAGMSRMPYREFAMYAYTGGALWVLTFVSIGYFAGEQWSKIGGTVERDSVIVAILIAIVAAVWFKWRRKRRGKQ
jgi:membrane protein DedA with SNARE-associated domain